MEPVSVHLAVLAIAEDPAQIDASIVGAVTEPAVAAGHRIIDHQVVADVQLKIRDQLARYMTNRQIDVVIVTGHSESEHTAQAIGPLITQRLPGFTDLFRWLAYQAIGASAMLSNAEAACCGETLVFVLPASTEAVRAAMEKLILPQLDPNTKPKNLIGMLPRLRPADAVPSPITAERTEAGAGIAARLPARQRQPTGKHVIAHHKKSKDPFAADHTKPIDVDKLEQQIALSEGADPTKQVKTPEIEEDPTGRTQRARSAPIEPPPPPAAAPARPTPPPPPGRTRQPTPPPIPTVRRPPTEPPQPPPPAPRAASEPTIARTPPQPTMRVYPVANRRNPHRMIIAALALVFTFFVVAIAWKLLSSDNSGDADRSAAAKLPPPPEPKPVVVPPPPPPAPADAPAPVDVQAVEVAPADAAVPSHAEKHSATHTASSSHSPPLDAAAAVEARTTEPSGEGCDEVACVMSHYDKPCCDKFKPTQPDFKPGTDLPDELTKPMVRAVVASVKPRIFACNDKLHAAGTVKVSVAVDGSGTVSSVEVAESPNAGLSDCVAGVMRAAKFGKSKTGGSFTYPFVF